MATYDARPSAFTQLTTTSEWEYLFSAAGIRDGVDNINALVPSLDTGGRNAVMSTGNAIIKGMLWRCDASVNTAIPAASAQNRIDRLVLRLTRGATTSPTVIQPFIITGTPSGTPVEPPLTQTSGGIWDIPICSWTSTSAGAITGLVDERVFSGATKDTWHDMRPLINSWVGTNANFSPPQYRFSNDYNWVEITGHIKNPSVASWGGVAFFTIPPLYRPPIVGGGERWACTGAPQIDGAVLGYTPCVQAYNDGRMTIEFLNSSMPANTVIGINGRYPINASGLLLS